MTLGDAIAKFLVQLAADGRSPHTIRQYVRHCEAQRLARQFDDLETLTRGVGVASDEATLARFKTFWDSRDWKIDE